MKRVAVAIIGALVLIASTGQANAQAIEDPIPAPIVNGNLAVGLDVLADGLTSPLWGTVPSGFAYRNHLYVVDQVGTFWAIDITTGAKTVVADVSDLLVPLGIAAFGGFDERGFLGAAFDANFRRNGYLYTYTSEPATEPADFSTMPSGVDADHQSVISRWQSTDPSDPLAPFDPTSRKVLLRVDEPQFNHNAGALAIGPDGMLYIALGDGGGADDVDGHPFIGGPMVGHGTGNGQDTTNPLGAILRIDPHGSNSTNGAYGIPRRNPFVGTDQVEEIYAYGFRNPYHMSFDRASGRLWTGDVGQNDIEEVNIVRRGGNYGWNLKEGSFIFDPNGTSPGFVTAPDNVGTIDPRSEYDHDEGISVIGGFVYRGRQLQGLQGRYIFGDFRDPSDRDGRLLVAGNRGVIKELLLPEQNGLGLALFGFGEDSRGELYVMGNASGIPQGDSGVVLKMVDASAQRDFTARLSGDAEVPPVESDGTGRVALTANRNWTELEFSLRLENLQGVSQAHIHVGPADDNGPVATFLISRQDPTIDVDGVRLFEGTLTADDLVGSYAGQPLSSLLVELQAGNAYVNVHTVAVPSGELRGQIR